MRLDGGGAPATTACFLYNLTSGFMQTVEYEEGCFKDEWIVT